MTLSELLKKFDELYAPESGFPSYEHSRHEARRDFITTHVTEMLEELRLEERNDPNAFSIGRASIFSFNEAKAELDQKIDNLLK